MIARTEINDASLYNAFGDKRAFYKRALDQNTSRFSITGCIRRCAEIPPLEAISAFFEEILKCSLKDPDHKGCMLVNAALDAGPDDPDFRKSVVAALTLIETFVLEHVRAGQADQSVAVTWPVETLAHHLLGALKDVCILARVRPEKHLLEGVIVPALAMLIEARLSPRDAAAEAFGLPFPHPQMPDTIIHREISKAANWFGFLPIGARPSLAIIPVIRAVGSVHGVGWAFCYRALPRRYESPEVSWAAETPGHIIMVTILTSPQCRHHPTLLPGMMQTLSRLRRAT